jgi:hypothetical protein
MDQIVALARDQQVLSESEAEQPSPEVLGVITDDACPDALLAHAARSNGHDQQRRAAARRLRRLAPTAPHPALADARPGAAWPLIAPDAQK